MMRRILVLGLLWLAACSGGKEAQDPPAEAQQASGRVQGQLTPFQGAGQQSMRVPDAFGGPALRELARLTAGTRPRGGVRAPEPPARRDAASLPVAEELPGEVILRFDEPNLPPEQVLQRVKTPGYRAVHKGYASEYLHLVAFERSVRSASSVSTAAGVSAAETGRLVTQLSSRPGVRFAEPNRRVRSLAVPDDGAFAFQWHYLALNLPAAWDVQAGNPAVVVAVIDSGIAAHPDLAGRVVPGIDMITDPANAADGDGRDDDPTDTGGDLPDGRSSWHGTHVAGTIGAATNNGIGVAGVTWAAQLLPVRVIGQQGANFFDIAAAMNWAAGGTVPGSRPNATPAKVINLSLGGAAPPQQVLQDIIDDRVGAAGALFVIAAGNESVAAATSSPCNQQNVICVGSTSLVGLRSTFSNFGAEVDVVAPGGELRQDLNGDGYPDGVLSTAFDEAGLPAYLFYEGTSMAAPHVAGVLALMASVKPDLTLAEAEGVLKATAVPAARCPEGCGAGLVNAQAAVRVLQGTPVSEPPLLAVNTPSLFFTGDGILPLLVYNQGGSTLLVTASASGPLAGQVAFPQGASLSVPALSAQPLGVAVTLAGLPAGEYEVPVTLNGGAFGSVTVSVRLRVGLLSAQDAVVVLVYQDALGNWQSAPELVTVAAAANGYQYAIDVPPRTYFVTAAIDDDQDGEFFEDGERIGFWRNLDSVEPIEVAPGALIQGINFDLIPFIPVRDSP